jgi:indolepyruvate ferredoxin oxidoreductase
MVYDKAQSYPETPYLLDRLGQISHSLQSFDAPAAVQKLFGSTAAANFLVIGAAYQTGALRLPAAAIEEAIGINEVAIDANIAAFRWGRVAIADPARFSAAAFPTPDREPPPAPPHLFAHTTFHGDVGDLIARRAANLVEFQSTRIAHR